MKKVIITALVLIVSGLLIVSGCSWNQRVTQNAQDVQALKQQLKDFKAKSELRNKAFGYGFLRDKYYFALADGYLLLGRYEKAVMFYEISLNKLRDKKNRISPLTRYNYTSLMHYNRACAYSLWGKPKLAMKDLLWLKKNGMMMRYVRSRRPFWKDSDFKNLQPYKPYQKLVKKWKAWRKALYVGIDNYAKACKLAKANKKAEALTSLLTMDKNGQLKAVIRWHYKFWMDTDLQNLWMEPKYQALAKKWIVWYKKNKKSYRN